MLRLSELLGSEVLSSTGTVVGRFVDLTVELVMISVLSVLSVL